MLQGDVGDRQTISIDGDIRPVSIDLDQDCIMSRRITGINGPIRHLVKLRDSALAQTIVKSTYSIRSSLRQGLHVKSLLNLRCIGEQELRKTEA